MIRSLQSWRFIFALMIFLHHFPVDGKGLFAAGGSCGVSFFLVLSGFVMSAGYGERVLQNDFNYGNYFKKRLTRVYPLHLLCLCVAALLLVMAGAFGLKNGVVLGINALLLQSWIPVKEIYFSFNAVSWCLCDFLFFYAMFPLLHRFSARIGLGKSIVLTGMAAVIYFVIMYSIPENWAHPLLYISPLFRLLDFVIGMLLYDVYRRMIGSERIVRRLKSIPYLLKSLAETVPIILLSVFIIIFPVIPEKFICASFWWIPSCLLIMTFAAASQTGGGMFSRLLENKTLVYLGNISFSFYMVHQLGIRILNILFDKTGIGTPWYINLALFAAIILAGSIIVSRYFEKPVVTALNRKLIRV